ncbi:MAG: cytochrome ubiquinol oxidase subunit II [Gammaproteobacteria bacterium]|nr:cytochrome ubiquinol oxidase subunit II [Gammaproteobacteria bacterium]
MTSRLRQARPPYVGVAILSSTLLLLSGCAESGVYLSFLNPQGPIAAAQRWHLIEVVVLLGVFVALPIFVLLPLLVWRYRYGAKSPRYTPKWQDYLPLEVMVWAGPIAIICVLGFLVWHYTHALDPYKPIAPHGRPLQVQAIGYDWKWLFIYPDQGIATVGVLAIPVEQPVAMRLTSATVMQSLLIPALAGQIYAMGGMVTQLHLKATKPGRSLGENTMYNGNGFHHQKFTALAMPPEEFKAWVRKVRASGVALDARAYKALSQRGTVAELVAALPRASHEGNIYLTQVSAALFPAVVEATMTGTPTALGHVLVAPAGLPAPVVRKTAASSMENAP